MEAELTQNAGGDPAELSGWWNAVGPALVEIASASELASACEAACRAAVRLGYGHAAVVLPAEDGASGYVRAEHPAVGMTGRHLALSDLPGAAASPTLFTLGDISQSDSLPLLSWLEGTGARSMVVVPVSLGDRTLGWLSLHRGRVATPDDARFVEGARVVALQLAYAAEHLRLTAEAAARAREIDRIRRASAGLVGLAQQEDGAEPILEAVVRLAVRATGAATGGVYRYNASTGELAIAATHPESGEVDDAGETLARRVAVAGAPVHHRAGSVHEGAPWLGVPLRWEDEVSGVLYVRGVPERTFDQNDPGLLAEAGAQAALALALRGGGGPNGDVAFERRGRGVHRAAAAILGNLGLKPLDEKLQEIASQAASVLNAEGCQVLVARSGELELRARFPASGGGAPLGSRFKISGDPHSGLTGYVAHTRTIFREHGDKLLNHPAVREMDPEAAAARRCYSLMLIPLLADAAEGEPLLVGVLRVENKRAGSGSASPETGFSGTDEYPGEIFASAVARMIVNEELLRAFTENRELLTSQVSTLAEVIELQGTPFWQTTQEALLRDVARRATRVTGYRCAVVYAVNAERNEAAVVVTHGVPAREEGSVQRLDDGFVGSVVRAGTIWEHHGTSRPGDGVVLGGTEYDAVIGVPLHGASGSAEWVLVVADRSESQPVSEAVRNNLQTLADNVRRLVQISRLWTWEEQSFRQTESLRLISAFIRSTRDREKLLAALLTGLTARYGLGYNRAAIYLLDEDRGHFEGSYAIGAVSRIEARDGWRADEKTRHGVEEFLRRLEHEGVQRTALDERVRGVRIPASPGVPDWVAPARAKGFAVVPEETAYKQWPAELVRAFEPASPLLLIPIFNGEELEGLVVLDNAYVPLSVEKMASEAARLVANGMRALTALEQGGDELPPFGGKGDEVREVYNQIATYALHIFGGSSVALWSYDPMSDRFTLRHSVVPGLPPEHEWREPQEAKILHLAREKEWLAIGDIDREPADFVSPETRELLRTLRVRSIQAVALRLSDRTLAVLCVGSAEVRELVEEHDRTIAVAFGRRAALVLRQAELRERVRRARTAAGVLAQVGTVTDPGDELQAMAETTLQALECHAVLVYEYEYSTGHVRTPPAVAAERGAEAPLRAALAGDGGEWLQHVLRRTSPWLPDPEDADFTNTPLARAGVRSCAAFPLRVEHITVGVLIVAHARPYRYVREELDDARMFANQIALAVHSQQLYRDLRAAASLSGIGTVDQNWSHQVAQHAVLVKEHTEKALEALGDGESGGKITPPLANLLRGELESLARLVPALREPPVKERFDENRKEVPVNQFLRDLKQKRETRSAMEIQLRLEASDDDWVHVNPRWLLQAFDALLNNAERELTGRESPRITLTSRRKGLRVELECADNGPGMRKEVRRRAGRAPIRSNRGGMGVGLILVQTIAMQYEGHLMVPEPAEEGQGATLWISLPCCGAPHT